MSQKHGREPGVNQVVHLNHTPNTEDNCPVLSHFEIDSDEESESDSESDDDDDQDDDDDLHDSERTYNSVNWDAQEENAMFLDIDSEESNEILHDSFSPRNLTVSDHNYPAFGNDASNTYFEQDFKMYHEEGELNGGIRGVYWQA